MGFENGSRQNTKNETKSIIDTAGFTFNRTKNQNHLLAKSRSEVVYKKDFPKPKVKANSVIEFNSEAFSPQHQPQQYHQKFQNQNQPPPQFHPQYQQPQYQQGYYNNNSQYNQTNSKFLTKPSNASPRAWSDVSSSSIDTRTELTNYSDPGSQVYNPQQKQTFNFPPHMPNATTYENNQHQQLSSEARSPKPRIAASAMMDIGDNSAQSRTIATVKPRKVAPSAQLNDINNFTDHCPDLRNDDEEDYNDEVDDDKYNVDEDDDQIKLDELKNLSSDPSIQRKLLDLKISNKSLLTLNVLLESTVKEQSNNLAAIPSFKTMMETQQKQLESLNKVEKLICTLSVKMAEQDNEIKVIKSQIIEKLDEKEKTRATLFYDPKSIPLNSLPNIIFDRAYDDITILFSVITSLLYTVYIFPVIVVARTAKQLVGKPSDKKQQ